MSNILIREAIEQVQTLYSKGVKSKNSRLSSRYIYSHLLNARGTVLKQQINKKQSINHWAYQSLNCIALESVSIPNSEKILLRTVEKIPTIITGLNGIIPGNVTSIDGSVIFDISSFEGQRYDKGKKYTAKKSNFYIKNQYGYINYNSKLKGISLYSLFNDPIEAYLFPSCGDCDDCKCKDVLDIEFPIDRDTLETVVKIASNELVSMFFQMKEDRNNNAMDDNVARNNMIHTPNEEQ